MASESTESVSPHKQVLTTERVKECSCYRILSANYYENSSQLQRFFGDFNVFIILNF